MSKLKVNLFGKFCVQHNGQVLGGFSARKVQELFAYLLLYRDQGHPRETLVSLLWGDQNKDTAQSKKSLRQVLCQLQAALQPLAESINHGILLVEPDWVQINSNADLWLDVTVFEQASLAAQGMPGEALDPHRLQTLQKATHLYQGNLLEGWYPDWCLYERERLQSMYLAMLDKLMGYCETHTEYEKGLTYGARILHYDRAHERTHRRLMRLHYLAGDRTAALRQYESCVAALRQELEVTPSQGTRALYEQVRADRLIAAASLPAEATAKSSPPVSLPPKVLEHIEHIRGVLAATQLQIQQDVQAITQAVQSQS